MQKKKIEHKTQSSLNCIIVKIFFYSTKCSGNMNFPIQNFWKVLLCVTAAAALF